jgi:hypothetical protein
VATGVHTKRTTPQVLIGWTPPSLTFAGRRVAAQTLFISASSHVPSFTAGELSGRSRSAMSGESSPSSRLVFGSEVCDARTRSCRHRIYHTRRGSLHLSRSRSLSSPLSITTTPAPSFAFPALPSHAFRPSPLVPVVGRLAADARTPSMPTMSSTSRPMQPPHAAGPAYLMPLPYLHHP